MSAFLRVLWHWLLPAAAVATLVVACAHRTPTGSPTAPPVPARARAVDPVDTLQAFAQLYGVVRYFHPTDAAADADWTALAAQGCAYVRDAKTLGELADRLEQFYRPLAPTLEIWVEGEPAASLREGPDAPHQELVYWQYLGYPGAVLSLYSPPYGKVRVGAERRGRRFAQMPARDEVVRKQILPGLSIQVPVMLHRDEAAAAPAGSRPDDVDAQLGRRAHSAKGYADADVRLAAVVEIWNVLRHFYPYQSEVHVDWDGHLRQALLDVGASDDLDGGVQALQRLVHALQDGHGEVGHIRAPGRGSLPFSLDIVEGRAVVVATSEPSRFAIGDVVERIGHETALDRIAQTERLLSGSPQWRRFKAAAWEVPKGPKGRTVDVTVVHNGASRIVSATYGATEPAPPDRPASIHRYDDGVWYVDLTRAAWADVVLQLPEIAEAPGVVFDMRGYPTDTHPIIDHLIDHQEDALWMHVPAIVAPGGDVSTWQHLGWHRKPATPHINGNVAFLTGPGAISYGESLVGYVQAHGLGTRVGAPTAGANGDIVRVDAAGGYFVIFSGMRVTRHDGTSFHRVGLVPDLPVNPTLAGLQEGRDEVLEIGLGVARGRIDPSTPAARIAAP